MAKKIREQAVSLISYLQKVKGGDISDNQDVQRCFCWDNSAVNELIVTVLTEDYIPPVILGEEEMGGGLVRQCIVDGLQRSSALLKFRYGNHAITPPAEERVIRYQRKRRGKNNRVCRDENNAVLWDLAEFNLKNKTYDMLPDELKRRFDDYQIRIVIYQDCAMEEVSKLVRRYNNHRAMNASQKAFTYIDRYARKIRVISRCGFLKDCTNYSETERKKGTYEKVICEAAMAVFHLESWKKQPGQMNLFLNRNSSDREFDRISEYADQLQAICGGKFKDLFAPGDIPVWFAVYDRFLRLNVKSGGFVDFLAALTCDLHDKEIGGMSYDSLNRAKGTKEREIIPAKIEFLAKLMAEYFGLEKGWVEGV